MCHAGVEFPEHFVQPQHGGLYDAAAMPRFIGQDWEEEKDREK
jgi:hypothetical protein